MPLCCDRYQGYYYYTRTEEGQQYAVHCRRAVAPGASAPAESDEPGDEQPEEVLLDENKRKEDGKHSFYMVGRSFVLLLLWCCNKQMCWPGSVVSSEQPEEVLLDENKRKEGGKHAAFSSFCSVSSEGEG
jgi:hypothetical protein